MGFEALRLGFGGPCFEVLRLGFEVLGLGFHVLGLGLGVSARFEVPRLGFEVLAPNPRNPVQMRSGVRGFDPKTTKPSSK